MGGDAVMTRNRFIMKLLPPLAAFGLVSSIWLSGCGNKESGTASSSADQLAGLGDQCVISAKLQCPFACAQIDTASSCHAEIGGGFDAMCSGAATGDCLSACGADCNIACDANAHSDCDSACNARCGNNCRAVCAGAFDVNQCMSFCGSDCGDQCASNCKSDTQATCQSKCNSQCHATCGVEAKVSCELRAAIDTNTACTASIAAKCMGDCTSDFTLRCVQNGDTAGASFDSNAATSSGASSAVGQGSTGINPVQPQLKVQ
jgi:hypothetical protein